MKGLFVILLVIVMAAGETPQDEDVSLEKKYTRHRYRFSNHNTRRRSCHVGRKVIPHGKTFNIPGYACQIYKCNNGAYRVKTYKCKDDNGRCYRKDATIEKGCQRYKCSSSGSGGFVGFQIDRTDRTLCKGADNRCYGPGRPFSCRLGGSVYHTCRCHLHGNGAWSITS